MSLFRLLFLLFRTITFSIFGFFLVLLFVTLRDGFFTKPENFVSDLMVILILVISITAFLVYNLLKSKRIIP